MAFKMGGWKGYSAKKQQENRFKDLEAELDNYNLKKKRELNYEPQSAFKKETRYEGPRNGYPKDYTKKDIQFLKDQNEDVVREQDKSFGRGKVEELKNDLIEIDKEIKRLSDKPKVVARLKKAKEEIQAALKKAQQTK
jgi:hypothetical protein